MSEEKYEFDSTEEFLNALENNEDVQRRVQRALENSDVDIEKEKDKITETFAKLDYLSRKL